MTANDEQFARTRNLLGAAGMERLRAADVAVAGLGAVGGYALEALARAGVGKLRLVDFDAVGVSNLNRQLLALHSTLGRKKCELARERVLDINPACVVQTFDLFIHQDTLPQFLAPAPDLLVDAIDALNPKVALLEYAVRHGIPVVSSMGAALRRDPSQITVGDLFKSKNCPLAKYVRKLLRRRGITKGIPAVYSTELVDESAVSPAEEEPYLLRGRRRNVLGSLPTITGIFGLTLANWAIARLAAGPADDGAA